jgi:NADPH:quinone reductase-like Zn-dependent oxidoreductase
VRAIAYERFGGPDVLTLTDLPEPPVAPDIVLVRTTATGVNPVDIGVRSGHLRTVLPTRFGRRPPRRSASPAVTPTAK